MIEEFKRGMNGAVRRKLMEAENQPGLIKQWFRRATVTNFIQLVSPQPVD